MQTFVGIVLEDAGFAKVNIDGGQNAQKMFSQNFKQGRAPSTALWFMSIKVKPGNVTQLAANLEADRKFTFDPSELVQIPFFDFYIVSQQADPPRSQPDELGHSEALSSLASPNKSVLTPIVLTAGSSNLSGLRKLLRGLDADQQAALVSQVICHEIGHSLGLRHAITFPGAPPYKFKDPTVRGVLGGAQTPPPTPTGATPEPFQFFGPVHQAAIRQWYL